MKALFLLCLVLFLSCNGERNTINPDTTTYQVSSLRQDDDSNLNYQDWGNFFYHHIKYHLATVDAMTYVQESERQRYQAAFDSLKATGNFNYEETFDKAHAQKQISTVQRDIMKSYTKDLLLYVAQNEQESRAIQTWCLDREAEIKLRADLSLREKNLILTYQSILRNYLKFRLEEEPLSDSSQKKGRIMAIQDDCSLLCPLNVVATFAGFASAFGGAGGAVIGTVYGILFLIFNPDVCSCPGVCQQATAVSVEDVCYNPSNGLKFKAIGYGTNPPSELIWYFYRDNTSGSPIVKPSTLYSSNLSDMVLTSSEINGASQIAVRVVSNCNGTYLNSQYFGYFVISELGKPRFVISHISATDPSKAQIGSTSWFSITGANYVPVSWYVSPTYGTVVQNSTTGGNFGVQWHLPTGTPTVSASASTACGSLTKSLTIQTYQ